MPKDFSKLIPNVVDPKLWPNPTNITPAQLQQYVSLNQLKINQSFRNYRRSALYLSGVLVGCLFMKVFVDKQVKLHIFGENGNGGDLLKMKTYNSIHDYSYNRTFQSMRYLTEEPTGDDANLKTREELLVDLGVTIHPVGLNQKLEKRAPHYKYLI